jgi:hypothetical protein
MDDDPFINSPDVRLPERRDQPMARLTDPIAPSASGSPLAGVPVADDRSVASAVRESLSGKQVCPFCGSQNASAPNATTNSTGPCPRCTMEDTAATRQATKARIGPWHVLQTRNPAAPGMRYATLLALVNKGQVTARSVVRGPTTHQLWRYAAHVKGLSREFGVCYSCGESIDKTAAHCPHCDRAQEPMGNPDALLEAREPAAVSISPVSDHPSHQSGPHLAQHAAIEDGSAGEKYQGEKYAGDSYPMIARQAAPQPILSHAERLRTANEVRMETRRRPDGRALSAMELAAALQVAPPPPPPQGHPVRTVVITLAVVAIIAGAIIGYARPDLRRQAQDWVTTTWTQVERKVDDFHLQKPPPGVTSSPQPGMPADTDSNATATGAQTTPQNSTPTEPPLVFSNNPPNNPAPAADNTPAQRDAMNVAPAGAATPAQDNPGQANPASIAPAQTPIQPAPAASPGPSAAQPAELPAAPTPAPRASILPDRPVLVGGVPSSSEIWVLHNRGLDAESRQDWAQAVRCYEQIEQAPKDQWPGDVKVRLENAQKQLAK